MTPQAARASACLAVLAAAMWVGAGGTATAQSNPIGMESAGNPDPPTGF